MAQLHRFDDRIYDHARTKTRSQSEEQHLSAVVASQRLHGRVIHDTNRAAERRGEVEANPALPQVPRLADDSAIQDGSWITDRDDLVIPLAGDPLHVFDHTLWRH